jgi:hypothetical protein
VVGHDVVGTLNFGQVVWGFSYFLRVVACMARIVSTILPFKQEISQNLRDS